MRSTKDLEERVWKSNMDLFDKNLVIQTFGNVSGLDTGKDLIAIKPSGISYTELTADKSVIVDLENRLVDSQYKPSTDIKTHLVFYKTYQDIE